MELHRIERKLQHYIHPRLWRETQTHGCSLLYDEGSGIPSLTGRARQMLCTLWRARCGSNRMM